MKLKQLYRQRESWDALAIQAYADDNFEKLDQSLQKLTEIIELINQQENENKNKFKRNLRKN